MCKHLVIRLTFECITLFARSWTFSLHGADRQRSWRNQPDLPMPKHFRTARCANSRGSSFFKRTKAQKPRDRPNLLICSGGILPSSERLPIPFVVAFRDTDDFAVVRSRAASRLRRPPALGPPNSSGGRWSGE
jgi:hypothetical protein